MYGGARLDIMMTEMNEIQSLSQRYLPSIRIKQLYEQHGFIYGEKCTGLSDGCSLHLNSAYHLIGDQELWWAVQRSVVIGYMWRLG